MIFVVQNLLLKLLKKLFTNTIINILFDNRSTHHPLVMGMIKIMRYMAQTIKRIVKPYLLSIFRIPVYLILGFTLALRLKI